MKYDFVKSEIVEGLMTRVFKFISENYEMEKKRKTWNLKKSQSVLEQAKERRTLWKFNSV